MQRTPSEGTERIERFAVCLVFVFAARGQESVRLELFFNWVVNLRHSDQRRSDRNGLHWLRDPARPKAAPSRRFHDQRDMHRGIVGKEAVLLLAMFAQ